MSDFKDALADFKAGKFVIVTDSKDREDEGDLIAQASGVTTEQIAFMVRHTSGVICAALTSDIAKDLKLPMMVANNEDNHTTAFTISVDLIKDRTTGISAKERANTLRALASSNAKSDQFLRPGHIFPLKSRTEGVLRRTGHTEASMDFARLAGFKPSGVLIEILNEDGSMARLPDLRVIADKFDLKLVTIKDLIEYRLAKESLIKREIGVNMPTEWGSFELVAFKQINTGDTHLALIKGSWEKDEPVMVRVHSSCVTGDIFGSCRCDCGEQLHAAMEMVEKEGKGVILYMFQEGRGIGLINKLKAYKLQEQGRDTVEANLELGFAMDERDYGVGAQILRDLGIHKIRLISNNPKKRAGLMGYGLEIVDSIGIEIPANPHNKKYLETKRDKMGHAIR